jgi:hypothetical protein
MPRQKKPAPPPLPPVEPRPAPGVAYSTSPHAPGLRLFRCEPFNATMADRGCGMRWREAQGAAMRPQEQAVLEDSAGLKERLKATTHGRHQASYRAAKAQNANRVGAVFEARASLDKCRSCPIGAAHAGATHVRYSRLYGASICPRCRKGVTRMIGGRTCVSCYNRSRELAKGRNARGNRPVELLSRAPHSIELMIAVDGRARVARVEGVDLTEVVIQTLRTTRGEVEFGFAGGHAELRQGRLF